MKHSIKGVRITFDSIWNKGVDLKTPVSVIIRQAEQNNDFLEHFPVDSIFDKEALLKAKMIRNFKNPVLITSLERLLKKYGALKISI